MYRIEVWLDDKLEYIVNDFSSAEKAWQHCWIIPEYRMFKSRHTFKVIKND